MTAAKGCFGCLASGVLIWISGYRQCPITRYKCQSLTEFILICAMVASEGVPTIFMICTS